ncbi:hypothetical protein HK097_003276 [Rhizophlyctis rosea]|uniref:C2H2-type domain-containing protein n=1 Tax=Rhizophlyctis rosea TaxID=64517 RepID=A0AAD5WXB0_9FUNG|nr:hypothetical protein HK097_003276 [Rhizophlyctis rosea]
MGSIPPTGTNGPLALPPPSTYAQPPWGSTASLPLSSITELKTSDRSSFSKFTIVDPVDKRNNFTVVEINEWRCPERGCGRVLESKGALQQHLDSVHKMTTASLCPLPTCNQSCQDLLSLKSHIVSHLGGRHSSIATDVFSCADARATKTYVLENIDIFNAEIGKPEERSKDVINKLSTSKAIQLATALRKPRPLPPGRHRRRHSLPDLRPPQPKPGLQPLPIPAPIDIRNLAPTITNPATPADPPRQIRKRNVGGKEGSKDKDSATTPATSRSQAGSTPAMVANPRTTGINPFSRAEAAIRGASQSQNQSLSSGSQTNLAQTALQLAKTISPTVLEAAQRQYSGSRDGEVGSGSQGGSGGERGSGGDSHFLSQALPMLSSGGGGVGGTTGASSAYGVPPQPQDRSAEISSFSSQPASSVDSPASQPASQPPKKRGPGRPPRQAQGDDGEGVQPTPSKGRGRPRKDGLPPRPRKSVAAANTAAGQQEQQATAGDAIALLQSGRDGQGLTSAYGSWQPGGNSGSGSAAGSSHISTPESTDSVSPILSAANTGSVGSVLGTASDWHAIVKASKHISGSSSSSGSKTGGNRVDNSSHHANWLDPPEVHSSSSSRNATTAYNTSTSNNTTSGRSSTSWNQPFAQQLTTPAATIVPVSPSNQWQAIVGAGGSSYNASYPPTVTSSRGTLNNSQQGRGGYQGQQPSQQQGYYGQGASGGSSAGYGGGSGSGAGLGTNNNNNNHQQEQQQYSYGGQRNQYAGAPVVADQAGYYQQYPPAVLPSAASITTGRADIGAVQHQQQQQRAMTSQERFERMGVPVGQRRGSGVRGVVRGGGGGKGNGKGGEGFVEW